MDVYNVGGNARQSINRKPTLPMISWLKTYMCSPCVTLSKPHMQSVDSLSESNFWQLVRAYFLCFIVLIFHIRFQPTFWFLKRCDLFATLCNVHTVTYDMTLIFSFYCATLDILFRLSLSLSSTCRAKRQRVWLNMSQQHSLLLPSFRSHNLVLKNIFFQ